MASAAKPVEGLRIRGNPGTDPEGVNPEEPKAAASSGGRPMAALRREGGEVIVEWKGERIPVDPASLKALTEPVRRRGRTRSAPPELQAALEAIRRGGAGLRAASGVVSVRAGYHFEGGRITRTPAVVVAVEPGAKPALPREVDGIAVETVPADPYELLARRQQPGENTTEALRRIRAPRLLIDEMQSDGETEEMARTITYRQPEGASLPEIEEAMTVTCHVSPDAGWKVLEPFLQGAQEEFVLGMYDFTAPHIYKAARSVLRDSELKWKQTLGPNESLPGEDDVDSTKANDLHEESIVKGLTRIAASRFQSAFARVGSGQTFASAYHIKVGVRDRKAFWLSSGNWQSSNQPAMDFLAAGADRALIASYNREWHVVVENEKLADIFRTYLEGDLRTATEERAAAVPEAAAVRPELLVPEDRFALEERAARDVQVFAPREFVFTRTRPLKVQPILTPDNYVQVVTELLRQRPRRTLYFQNQSLNPVKQPTEEFAELMDLLIGYSNDPSLDVRIIFRNIGPVRKKLESLQAAGFDMSRIRMQAGCHTKGIIIDSETVLLGSHNFTNDGVQYNRDASLLIHDAGIARYYEDVFLHDWERLARPAVREEEAFLLADSRESTPLGYTRAPWSAFEDED